MCWSDICKDWNYLRIMWNGTEDTAKCSSREMIRRVFRTDSHKYMQMRNYACFQVPKVLSLPKIAAIIRRGSPGRQSDLT